MTMMNTVSILTVYASIASFLYCVLHFYCDVMSREHPYKLYKLRRSSAVRRKFFVDRVVNVWNFLPPTVNFISLSTFNSSLSNVDFYAYLLILTELCRPNVIFASF